ncbi:ABC transporter family substrate-binding protein [Actinospica durhamensis]|uniref:ABC transporter family substrate-binding protein n=1 Tax=Actinospica durhamensis TaxID=1508375 RepID=A0A941EPD1_9ACTN|nr:ABC transporter family substrate-binding protein [Actinospica durhamensis]MBR7834931.1 ABC transporter family substrate-binding protein [Actinospica durhamensis]
MSGIRRRRLAAGMAVLGALALAATACSSAAKTATPVTKSTAGLNTINSGTPKKGGSITVGIEKAITNWNSLDANGNTEDFIYAENGFYAAPGSPYVPNPDGSVSLNTNLLTSATLSSTSPQTVVYQINPKAVWNDGTPITAQDFIYNWLTQAGVDPNISAASTSGYMDMASVVGSGANDQTVTVTWKTGKVDPDWKGLFDLLPAHLAAQHGYNTSLTLAQLTAETKGDKGLEASWTWFDNTVPTWSDGPYEVQSASSDGTKVVEVPNPKWYGATGPYLDKITFVTISDSTQEVPALQNGEVNIIIPQPSQDIVTGVKAIGSKVKYQVDAGLTFEHFDFNMQNTFLGGKTEAAQEDPVKLALRQAMFTATNRTAIIARTQGLVDPTAKPLNSRMFVPSQSQYADNVSSYDLGNGDIAKATQLLKTAGYTNIGPGEHLTTPSGQVVPTFLMRYTEGNTERATECQIFAEEMAQLGISIKVESTDDLGATLTQADANHTYDIIVFAWVDTPFWDTGNAPLYESNPGTTVTGGNYGFYTNSQVDSLLQQATDTTNLTLAASLENQADKIVSQDSYTLPLFQKDTMVAFDSDLVNVRDNLTSAGPSYNIQDWGFAQ